MAKSKKKSNRQTQPMTKKQTKQLLTYLKGEESHKTRLLVAAGCYLGLRISDLLKLKWEMLLNDSVIQLVETKTGKINQRSVNGQLRKIAKDASKQLGIYSGYVFTSDSNNCKGKVITTHAANARLKKAFENAGIKVANPSSHTLRKTFGKAVYDGNGGTESALILLSNLFDHSSIAITRKYIGLTDEKMNDACLSISF